MVRSSGLSVIVSTCQPSFDRSCERSDSHASTVERNLRIHSWLTAKGSSRTITLGRTSGLVSGS